MLRAAEHKEVTPRPMRVQVETRTRTALVADVGAPSVNSRQSLRDAEPTITLGATKIIRPWTYTRSCL